ncbi:hypothetical protein [Brevibacillus sp. H7]|uniref:hypothetical protein n=1 Tax=Brevibacillus sp. H7 TaxID=3349138 RepID=UPI00382B7EF4
MMKWKRTMLTSALVFSMSVPMSVHAVSNPEPPTKAYKKENEVLKQDLQTFIKQLQQKLAKKEITLEQFREQMLNWFKLNIPEGIDDDVLKQNKRKT